MNNENDFEIIDDFDDVNGNEPLSKEGSSPVPTEDVPTLKPEEENDSASVEPLPSFEIDVVQTNAVGENTEEPTVGDSVPVETNEVPAPETPVEASVSSEETLKENNEVSTDSVEQPQTFSFDGFEGALGNNSEETAVDNSAVAEAVEPAQESAEPMPVDTLAAPGSTDVLSGGPALNMDVEPKEEVKENSPQETKESEKEEKKEKGGSKIAIIVILFVIIIAAIILIPYISK